MKTGEIRIFVTLDEQTIPEKITWSATDDGKVKQGQSKAMFHATWDEMPQEKPGAEAKSEVVIKNLWVKNMPQEDMKKFFYGTLMSLGDTFSTAMGGSTEAKNIVADLRDYCVHFAEKMGLAIPSENKIISEKPIA